MFEFAVLFRQFGGESVAYSFSQDMDALERLDAYLASLGYDDPDECDGYSDWMADDFLCDPE